MHLYKLLISQNLILTYIIDDTMEDISNNSQENFKPVLTSPFFEECIQANFSNLDYPKLLNVTKVA